MSYKGAETSLHKDSENEEPGVVNLNPEFLDLSSTYNHIFDMEELFPPFYGDVSDICGDLVLLISDNKMVRRKNKLTRLHKINEKFIKKINSIISFIKTSYKTIDFNKNPHEIEGELNNIPSINVDDHKAIEYHENKGHAKANSIELWENLETENSILLETLKDWSFFSTNHKIAVKSLTKYQKLIRKYIKKYTSKEDIFAEFYELLNGLKHAYLDKKHHMDKRKCNKLKGGEEPKKGIRRFKKKDKSRNIWTQLNLYFLKLDKKVKDNFDKLMTFTSNELSNGKFLNMFAINRLSAIAKMLDYCNDTKSSIKEFMSGRTYQKLRAHFKQIEELDIKDEINHLTCPSLDEVPFLTSIEYEQLPEIIESFKNMLSYYNEPDYMKKYNDELETITQNNKELIYKIQQRMMEPEKTSSTSDSHHGIKRNCETITIDDLFKKKLKKIKTDNSNSDTNTNQIEYQLKPSAMSLSKFKITTVIPPMGFGSKETIYYE